MSLPVMETVRTIPLIIEKDAPMEYEEITGYPFERDNSDRDGYLRSQLDDIAKRHPEIAEHLENFGQRERQRTNPPSNEGPSSPRRFPRQFSDRFERFGFPFDREDFDPEYYSQQFYQPHQQPHSQQHSSYQQPPSENLNTQSTYPQPPPSETCSSGPPTASRCNSDLGQQPPVDERSQRSMSAPPSENSPDQREYSENMSQSQAHSETKSSNERIIPIHIEGRDEPVLPKGAGSSFSQQQHGGPPPERIFGKPSEHFTQFLPHGRDSRFANNWHQGFGPEEPVRQHRFQSQQNAPPKRSQEYVPTQPTKEDIPIPVQREAPPKPQEQPKQSQRSESPQLPQEPPKPAQQAKPLTPIEQIQAIQKDVSSFMAEVEAFTGKSKDKQYLYLDEMLTRNLIKLDNIDTQGQDNVRSARKEAIKNIEKMISVLEAKASGSEPLAQVSTMEVDEKTEVNTIEQPTEQKEVISMDTEVPSIQEENKQMEVTEGMPDVKPINEVEPTVQDKEETAAESISANVEQVPEGNEVLENVTQNKGEDIVAPEKVESNISEPQEISNTSNQQESENNDCKDQIPDSVQSSTEVAAKAESESEDKKGKKDKKKGKKKVEKKEK